MQSTSEEPIISRQWILKARPNQGDLTDPTSLFSKQSQQLAPIQDDQVLVKVLYISVDSSNLGWTTQDSFDMPAVEIGENMRAMGIAQVLQSKNKHFQPGEIVNGLVGWQEYVILNPSDKTSMMKLFKLTDDLPLDDLICMPLALKAYYGIVDKAKIRSSDNVLIIGAAGTAGVVAGQVAKMLGAKTAVGFVDSPQQSQWLTSACRFDAAIDVNNEDIDRRLQDLFPKGINVIFDATGSEQHMHVIMTHLAHAARVVLCGTTPSQHNQQKQHGLDTMSLIAKSTTVYCFMLRDYKGQLTQAALTLSLCIKYRRLVLKVDQKEGFDCIPNTLKTALYDQTITGKQVVKLSDPPLPIHTDWWFKALIKGLAIITSVIMLDKFVNFAEEKIENKAIGVASREVQTQADKKKKDKSK